MKFLAIDEVFAIHDQMLRVGGGRAGVHDFRLLHSAVERPKSRFGGKYLYTSLWQMAAALLHSLVKNHPFEDGNKRTALFSTIRFLHINGYEFQVMQSNSLDFMVKVDVENKTLEEIAKWLKGNSKKV